MGTKTAAIRLIAQTVEIADAWAPFMKISAPYVPISGIKNPDPIPNATTAAVVHPSVGLVKNTTAAVRSKKLDRTIAVLRCKRSITDPANSVLMVGPKFARPTNHSASLRL
jgi:hypothetical protein